MTLVRTERVGKADRIGLVTIENPPVNALSHPVRAALLEALDSGIVAGAGLDVFENEPNPRADILQHPRVSLTPHTGASTEEAQLKIGEELAQKLIAALKG